MSCSLATFFPANDRQPKRRMVKCHPLVMDGRSGSQKDCVRKGFWEGLACAEAGYAHDLASA